MKNATCPSPQTLQRFLLGTLPGIEREILEEHLLDCDQCVANAETITTDDELTQLVRHASVSGDNQSEAVLTLIDRIKAARMQAETMRLEETIDGSQLPGPASAFGFANEASPGLSFLAPAESADELGRLGEYRVLQVIGVGGMGVVLKAEDLRLKRVVALKTMKHPMASSRDAKSRFLREAQATAALEHDHIVPIYQVGEDRGVPFIAMQLLKGESLAKRLERVTKLSTGEVVRLGKEVALGLSCAHEAGMIHRDIKPDNIWLDEATDRAKVLDFGLVSATSEDEGLTNAGTVLGTPKYMAPEQALGYPVDHRADLFSLGSVLYHAAAGEAPFMGNTFTSTLIAVANQQPKPLQDTAPDLPSDAMRLIMQLLDKDPNQRPLTAKVVAQQFAGLEQELRDVRTKGTHAGSVSEAFPDRVARARPPRKPPQRKLLLASAGGVAALLLGVLVITVRNKDGKETVLRVPSGTEIDAAVQPGSKVTIREEESSDETSLPDKPSMTIASSSSLGDASTTPPAAMPAMTEPIAIPAAVVDVTTPELPAAAALDFATERKIAERLVRLAKGKFLLGNKDLQPVVGWSLTPLPSEPFCILEADLSQSALTNQEIVALKGCQVLRRLDASRNPALTDVGFERLGPLPALTSVAVNQTAVGDQFLTWLANSPELETIDLRSTMLTAEAGEQLPALASLETLRLPATFTSDGLSRLGAQSPFLRELDSQVTDPAALASLAGRPHLVKLGITGAAVTAETIKTLASLPHMESLVIHQPTREAVALLPQLDPRLVSLELIQSSDSSELTTSDLKPLATMKQLVHLAMRGALPVDAEVLSELATIKWLRSLTIDQASESDRLAFRQQRPDLELIVGDQRYPALDDWPGKFEGNTSIAAWDLPAGSPSPAIAPLTPADAAQHQAAWAKYLNLPIESENSIGMKFRLIPPGEWTGETATTGYQPARTTLERVTNAFEMGMAEVSVAQFEAFVKATGYVTEAERAGGGFSRLDGQWGLRPETSWRTPGYELRPDFPVTVVTQNDAKAFCKWLSKTDGLAYGLPNPAEWRLAGYAGGQGPFGWCAQEAVLEHDWFRENRPDGYFGPQPVLTKKPNPYGIFNALGNVSEILDSPSNPFIRIAHGWSHNSTQSVDDVNILFVAPTADTGFRVMRSQPNSINPIVKVPQNAPLSSTAMVPRPTPIPGVRSWSLELAGKKNDAFGMDWSPKNDLIALAGGDERTIRLFDRNGKLKSVLLGHEARVTCVAFSPDGKYLASGSMATDFAAYNELRIWDVATGKFLWAMPYTTWIWDLTWSPDGQWIAIGGTNAQAALVNVSQRTYQRVAVASDINPRQLAFDAVSKRLFVVSGGKVRGWEIATSAFTDSPALSDTDPGTQPAARIATSPDGLWLAIATQIGKIRLWDLHADKLVWEKDSKLEFISEIIWSPDSQQIAMSVPQGSINVLSLEPDASIRVISGRDGDKKMAWSPDSRELAVYSHHLTFVDSESASIVRQGPQITLNRQRSFLPAADNQLVFGDRQFDSLSGMLAAPPKSPPPGELLLIPSHDQWRVYRTSGQEYQLVPQAFDRDTLNLTAPEFTRRWRSSPTGAAFAYVDNNRLHIGDASTGDAIRTIDETNKILSFEWSPNGEMIAILCGDNAIRVWKLDTDKILLDFKQPDNSAEVSLHACWADAQVLCWSADSQSIEAPLTQGVVKIDVPSGRTAIRPKPWHSYRNAVGLVTASPNQQRMHVWEDYGSSHTMDRWHGNHEIGFGYDFHSLWHADSRRLIGNSLGVLRAYDAASQRRLGTLWPTLTDGNWLVIGPTGHCRGSNGVAEHVVYVAQLDDGSNITLSPIEFAKRFGWKNDPDKATLMEFDE